MSSTPLQRRDARRREERIRVWEQARTDLGRALSEWLPGRPVYIFGSLTRPGVFNARSDVDLALEREPAGMSLYGLTGVLEEALGRRVDILLLERCRFASKIREEGELWTS